jgi:3'-phosphoadenosine 5'-phosphosulfate (PAPS) 3'-phosphatase
MAFSPLVFTSMTKAVSLCLGMGVVYLRRPYPNRERTWDLAPIVLFTEEAGGIVTNGTGEKLEFANDGFTVHSEKGCVFSNQGPELHRRFVEGMTKIYEL